MFDTLRFLRARDRDRRADLRAQGDEPGCGAARAAGCDADWRRRPPTAAVPPPLAPLQQFEQTLPPASAGARRSRRHLPMRNPSLPPPSLTQTAAGRRRAATAAAAARSRFRGNRRHPLGGVDRRPDAGARRLLHGPLFDRGRPARPRRAHHARRPVRAGAACRRRMDAPQGEHLRHRGAADRQYSGDPHRRRHGGRVCHGLRGLRAVRLPGAGHRLHPARTGRARHARRGAAARAGAGRSRRRRRLRHARSWSRPTSRTSGRSTSISRSSPRRPSVWRGSGCGAGSRSPPSRSRCCGPSPACNAARRWSARMPSTSSPASSSRHCWWCAASCSARRRTRARSSRSRPVRSRPICSARR